MKLLRMTVHDGCPKDASWLSFCHRILVSSVYTMYVYDIMRDGTVYNVHIIADVLTVR